MKVRQIKRRYHARIIRAAVTLFPSCLMVGQGEPMNKALWVRMTRYDSLSSLAGNIRAVDAYNRTIRRKAQLRSIK